MFWRGRKQAGTAATPSAADHVGRRSRGTARGGPSRSAANCSTAPGTTAAASSRRGSGPTSSSNGPCATRRSRSSCSASSTSFPMLHTPEQVYEYLVEYLGQPGVSLPPGIDLGLKAGGLAKGLLAKTIAGRIRRWPAISSPAPTPPPRLPALRRLWEQGVAFSVDLLGEACVSPEEARGLSAPLPRSARQRLPAAAAGWPPSPLLENDHLGRVPRASVSIKISSLCARTDPIDFEGSLRALEEALRPILAGRGPAATSWSISTWSRRR